MAISEALLNYRKENKLSQHELAEQVPVDRTMVTKWEKGMEPAEHHDAALSGIDWRLTLTVGKERTGGFYGNILETIPDMNLDLSAQKEMLLRDLDEAEKALEDIIMAQHLNDEERIEQAEELYLEIRDVMLRSAVLSGSLEERFNLDRDRLIKRHDLEVRQGKR